MREIRPSGSEEGVTLTTPSLPLSRMSRLPRAVVVSSSTPAANGGVAFSLRL